MAKDSAPPPTNKRPNDDNLHHTTTEAWKYPPRQLDEGSIVPIRVNSTSADGIVRIIDTILLDLDCLPVPFCPPAPDPLASLDKDDYLLLSKGNQSSFISSPYRSAYRKWIERNVQELACGLLADMEVYGMTRTARHFAGRVDLMGNGRGLRDKVKIQIRDQLCAALDLEPVARKRRRVRNHDEIFGASASSEVKTEDSAVMEPSQISGDSCCETSSPKNNAFEKNLPLPESPGKEKQIVPKPEDSNNLIRIKLRLREGGILLIDEFDFDATTPYRTGGCPVAVAESIVQDLKLPPEFAVSIATAIFEQVHGVVVEGSLVGMEARARRDVTAAWCVDPRENLVIVGQIVADSRPTVAATSYASAPGSL